MAEELAQRIKNGEPLLGPEERARVRVRPAMQAPGMADLAERLSDRLETRVRVQLGKRKGRVLIEFATLDDLQRICDAIGLEQRAIQLPDAPGSADDPQVVREERETTIASA
jgi:ParB family chromosome partitioning protein